MLIVQTLSKKVFDLIYFKYIFEKSTNIICLVETQLFNAKYFFLIKLSRSFHLIRHFSFRSHLTVN